MTTILALDSATENCSVALEHKERIFIRQNADKQQHAACILQMLDEVLHEANCSMDEVEALVYGQGPGSFTGVRVAVSAAQGLALGQDLPLSGVSSLAALAHGALAKTPACDYAVAAIDARMGEVYLGLYVRAGAGVELLSPEVVLRPEDAVAQVQTMLEGKNFVTAGTGIKLLQSANLNCAGASELFPQGTSILALGKIQLQQGKSCDAAQAQPVYIRNEVTWKKLEQQPKPI